MQIIIDAPDEKYDRLIKQMQLDRNFSACKISILPKEVITNGDMLKAIFPNIQTKNESTDFITYSLDGIVGTCVEAKWWNAPYERS